MTTTSWNQTICRRPSGLGATGPRWAYGVDPLFLNSRLSHRAIYAIILAFLRSARSRPLVGVMLQASEGLIRGVQACVCERTSPPNIVVIIKFRRFVLVIGREK